jgi:hypothetical protein
MMKRCVDAVEARGDRVLDVEHDEFGFEGARCSGSTVEPD